MFAVPGWNLKTEVAKEPWTKSTGKPAVPVAAENDAALSKTKKRKRPSAAVTSANVSDLWERVIEGKSASKKNRKTGGLLSDGNNDDQDGAVEGGPRKKQFPTKMKKEKRREKRQRDLEALQEQRNQVEDGGRDSQDHQATKTTPAKPAKADAGSAKKSKAEKPAVAEAVSVAAPPPAPKLTPLQSAMREKLVSARFRHLNETLYTKPSADAFDLFEASPEMFHEYHEGFRRQVEVWPENPVDGYIDDLKRRGRHKPPPRDSKRTPGRDTEKAASDVVPLPRTRGTCTVADLGCGDAKLAETLRPSMKKLGLQILSYDLQSPSSLVKKADIANLPLQDGSVNVVIFCLALMGTNWLDFIDEAYRILHWKGELWIAEIKSRFAPLAGQRKLGRVKHSVGNMRKVGKKCLVKDRDTEEDVPEAADLAVELDGAEDQRQDTDVSAFVEALHKRGFVLEGDVKSSVDLSNKMFVKMRFLKGVTPVTGKGARGAPDAGRVGPRKNSLKFIELEGESKVDEKTILKPCVYKLR